MQIILHNRIRCVKCGDVIESTSVHDYKTCSCGLCAVDGGKEYLRRCGNRENWEELSVLTAPISVSSGQNKSKSKIMNENQDIEENIGRQTR